MNQCYKEHKKGKVVLATRNSPGDSLYLIYPNGRVETEYPLDQTWFESAFSARTAEGYKDLLQFLSSNHCFSFIASWKP